MQPLLRDVWVQFYISYIKDQAKSMQMFNPHALHHTAQRHEHFDRLPDLLLSLKSDQPQVYILVMKGFRQIKGDSFGELYVHHISYP